MLYFGQQPKGTKFLILGIDPPEIAWNAPVPLTERAVEYVGKLLALPEKGADRLAFFQDYLEDKDELLARDAYDEFAKAPYSEVKDLKDRMQHDKLVAWIQDKNVLASRRRLYLTMLGVCGTEKDVQMLEELITREEPDGEPKTALDAMIACYLTLKGPDGMPLIEEHFLANAEGGIHGHLLGHHGPAVPRAGREDHPQGAAGRRAAAHARSPATGRPGDSRPGPLGGLASMDKLVKLFKESDDKTSWVRVPVVQFLRACPLPEAQQQIAELEKIDPESVKRASFFVGYGSKPAGSQTAAAAVPPPCRRRRKTRTRRLPPWAASPVGLSLRSRWPIPIRTSR